MSIRDDLYQLWQKADNLAAYEAFQKREAEEVIKQRDRLLEVLAKHKIQDREMDEGACRNCDAPMRMKKWAEQYCYHCSKKE